MTRRKSVCMKWTLVLYLFVLSPLVYSRPQETSADVSISVITEKTTEIPLRYRFHHLRLSFGSSKLNLHAPINNTNSLSDRKSKILISKKDDINSIVKAGLSNVNYRQNYSIRASRLISGGVKFGLVKKKNKPQDHVRNKLLTNVGQVHETAERKKPEIKKIITKWTDKINDDLNFSLETTTSDEVDRNTYPHFGNLNDDSSNENSNKISQTKKYPHPQSSSIKVYNKNYRPRPTYSEETQVYSNNFHVIDSISPHKPYFTYTTPIPSPSPIITNVGYPKPWTQTQNYRKPTTPKPIHDYNQNSVNNYYPGNFEVTTFQPTSAYTDRIVIRPEDYSGTPDECPTIFLTLNNTFQGQGKEGCPDLNIAVNTNVINKNVVVESEEEDTESLFPGAFGIPLGDDSSNDDSAATDYFQSDENQADSASDEATELTNYHSVNAPIQSEPSEPVGLGSPSSQLTAISKPHRPSNSGDDEDLFSFSSIGSFFRPAFSALGWLASINPLTISFFSLLLTPLAFLFGTSSIAALFSPFLAYGREATDIVHVHKPHWHWDDNIKTWHLHSFPESRLRSPRDSKIANSTIKPTFFFRLKEWLKAVTNRLRNTTKNKANLNERKNRRRKRETWAIRVK